MREATLEDLDGMWRIEHAVFGADAWSRDMLREELSGPHRHYLVLTEAGTAAEAATRDVVRGYAGLLAVGEVGDIQTIAIDPALRGRGHGRTLMLALAEEAARRGVRDVFLEVRADNTTARHLYHSLGFAEVTTRRGYYQPEGVDAIVMQARIAADTPRTDHVNPSPRPSAPEERP